MAYIQEKSKGKKIISFKFKTYLDRDENGKQIVKCMTWYIQHPYYLFTQKGILQNHQFSGGFCLSFCY